MAAKHNRMIKRAARKHGIPPKWLYGLWGAEHGLKERGFQRSTAGAQGPFQFMPATARSYGINPYKFGQAADAAAKYLAAYKGRGLEGMYRAYNAGPAGSDNPESRAHYQAAVRYMQQWPGAKVNAPQRKGRTVTTKKVVVPGVDRSEARKALLLEYLESRDKPGALLDVARGLPSVQDTKERTVTTRKARKKEAVTIRDSGGKTDIVSILKLAQRMGLTVREHPKFDPVDPVHTEGSYHYRKAKRSRGAAGDVSGPVHLMRKFAAVVAKRYGRDLEELIWRGPGARAIKRGRAVSPGFFSGHTDHVHVADID